MDESNGNSEGRILHDFSSSRNYNKEGKTINFLTTGQQAATFSWQDKRTLSQIERMTGYKVKPRGVVSQFKYGGFVVFEKKGHGLAISVFDIGVMNWHDSKIACNELVLSGYNDWYLPSNHDLENIYFNLFLNGVGGFIRGTYWTSSGNYLDVAGLFNFQNGKFYRGEYKSYRNLVRAVRSF